MIRREDTVTTVPVLSRPRHEIRKAIEKLVG